MSITDTLHSGHLVTADTFFVESAESNQTLIENPYIADTFRHFSTVISNIIF